MVCKDTIIMILNTCWTKEKTIFIFHYFSFMDSLNFLFSSVEHETGFTTLGRK